MAEYLTTGGLSTRFARDHAYSIDAGLLHRVPVDAGRVLELGSPTVPVLRGQTWTYSRVRLARPAPPEHLGCSVFDRGSYQATVTRLSG